MKKINYKKDYLIIIMIFIISNFLILRKITMFEIFPDETNTLAILAKLTGNFWDLDKAYYGWGGVIFYYPLFLLIKNPVLLYKSILLVNAILLSFIPCISYKILGKFFSIENRKLKFFSAIFLGIYPGTFATSQYAWNETWVRLIVWLILFFILKLSYTNKDKNKNSLILGFLLAYSYSIHGRMLALIPTIFIVYFIFQKLYNDKLFEIKSLLYGFIPMFFLDYLIKKEIIKYFFSKEKSIPNTFLDVIKNFLQIFDSKFLIVSLRVLSSYTFYISITSFGIATLGIILLFKLIKNNSKEKKSLLLIGLFSYIGLIFTIIIQIVFFAERLHGDNNDVYIRGRYTDCFTSIIILFVITCLIKKKINKMTINQAISILIVHSNVTLLIESSNVNVMDLNALSFISFVSDNVLNSLERFYVVVVMLILISIYILVMSNKSLYLVLFTGISIYIMSNINLAYHRNKKSIERFSIIKNEYKVLQEIKHYSSKKNLNFITNGEIVPGYYLMLLNDFNVDYREEKFEKIIGTIKENFSLVNKNKSSIMLGNDVYKIYMEENNNQYDLYYRGEDIKRKLDDKHINSLRNNIYVISFDKLYSNNGNKELDSGLLILKPKIMLFGPYIELRPNNYKIVINGEELDNSKIIFNLNAKKGNEKNSSNIDYNIIKRDKNQYIVEFSTDKFIKDFETILINNSNSDITIKSIQILVK